MTIVIGKLPTTPERRALPQKATAPATRAPSAVSAATPRAAESRTPAALKPPTMTKSPMKKMRTSYSKLLYSLVDRTMDPL